MYLMFLHLRNTPTLIKRDICVTQQTNILTLDRLHKAFLVHLLASISNTKLTTTELILPDTTN